MVDAGAVGRIDGVLHRHGLRVAEIKPLARFGGDNDRRAAVRCEVHIIRIVDGDIFPGFAG